MATEHYGLEEAGSAGTLNQHAINDGNVAAIERGRTYKFQCGESGGVAKGDLCYLHSSGKWKKGTNSNRPLYGLAVANAALNEDLFVQVEGVMIDDGVTPDWNWTPFALLYAHASTAGALTESAGGSAVAQAIASTQVLILPGGMQAGS